MAGTRRGLLPKPLLSVDELRGRLRLTSGLLSQELLTQRARDRKREDG